MWIVLTFGNKDCRDVLFYEMSNRKNLQFYAMSYDDLL